MPVATCPSVLSTAIATKKTAPRSSRSATQASARTTGPARRKLSSMPSGVGTSRSVSNMIEGTRNELGGKPRCASGVVDEDVAVAAINRCEQRWDQHQPAEEQRDAGDHAQREDDDAIEEKWDDVLERPLKALLHGIDRRQAVKDDEGGCE